MKLEFNYHPFNLEEDSKINEKTLLNLDHVKNSFLFFRVFLHALIHSVMQGIKF